MSHVFISYSRRNKELVDRMVGDLEKAGINVWLDREDIKAGDSWRLQIVEAIDACDAFVLMLSPESAASENVHKEVILAADSKRKTFIVMLEPVKMPAAIRYQLAGLQHIDLKMLGMETCMEQLTSVLNDHLKKIKSTDEATKKTELVIQGIDLSQFTADKQEQLLAFISNLAQTDRSQLKIAGLAAGSVHVFVEMPALTAYKLKTAALNSDPRFAGLNITLLRVVGDTHYIDIVRGVMVMASKPALFGYFNLAAIIIPAILVIVAVLFFLLRPASSAPPVDEVTASPSPTADSATPTFVPSDTVAPDTVTPEATPTFTLTVTEEPSATPTSTPIVLRELTGTIVNARSACNYGPGDLYLNNETLQNGLSLQVYGRNITSDWVYVLADGYKEKCWVSVKNVSLDGSLDELEMLYPGKVTLPPSDFWDPPQNVYTARSRGNPDKLSIYWDEFILADGDLERSGAPRYLLELWLCKGGELTFTPIFAWQNNVVVDDEAGCSEPSHGVIYLAEKHGYPGPVNIPWEPHP